MSDSPSRRNSIDERVPEETEHELREDYYDLLFDDDVAGELDHIVCDRLYKLDLEDSEFSEEIRERIESAREDLIIARDIRAAEIAAEVLEDDDGT